MQKPTAEDYKVNPVKMLEVQAKATKGRWKKIKSQHKGYSCVQLGYAETYTTSPLHPCDAAAIVNAHEGLGPVLLRLIELEEAVLALYKRDSEGMDSILSGGIQFPYNHIMLLADRIKAGREAQA